MRNILIGVYANKQSMGMGDKLKVSDALTENGSGDGDGRGTSGVRGSR